MVPNMDTTNNVKKMSKNFNEEESELINEFVFPETVFKCVGINISIEWGMFLRIVWSNAFCRLFINDMEYINVPIQLFLIQDNESSRGAFIHLSRKFPIPFTLKGDKIKIVVYDFIVIGNRNKESKMNEVYTLMLSCYKRK